MKKILFSLTCLLAGATISAQNIVLSFDNAIIETVGSDEFYEVDVLISADMDFILGEGQLFYEYNTAAFGPTIAINNRLTNVTTGGAILGTQFSGLFDNYTIDPSNDNLPNRASISWAQNIRDQEIGINVTSVPRLLYKIRIRYVDSSQPAGLSFVTLPGFSEQFNTACGGANAFANCFTNPGLPIMNGFTEDPNSDSEPPTPTNYVWALNMGTASWTPANPSGIATEMDNIMVQAPGAMISGVTRVNNLTIDSGATLALGTDALLVSGDVTVNGTLTALAGDVQLVGTESQMFSANPMTGTSIATLTMLNTSGAASFLTGDLDITNALFLNEGALDVTNGTLTLKSAENNGGRQAMVGPVANGSITGNVVVETFIPARRAFRFVSSPVNTTGSINANYQEGATPASPDPAPGFGTHITGSTTGANGFDQSGSGAASMFSWSNAAQSWNGVANTASSMLTAGTPYRLFVRGSRAVDLTSNTSPADATTLRTSGTLVTGNTTQSFMTDATSSASEFMMVGNPYAAAVDLTTVSLSNLNGNFYYAWDTTLGLQGAYVTVDLPSGTNSSGSTASSLLVPGQSAFYALSSTAPSVATSITFEENDKNLMGTSNVFGSANAPRNTIVVQLKNMNLGNPNPIVDSFKVDFDNTFTNAITSQDAPKLTNLDESIATVNGLNKFAIERRALPVNAEEIPMSFSNYRANAYVLTVDASDFNSLGMTAYLYDSFLNTTTVLTQGVNDVNFTVDPSNGSSADDRFRLVFSTTTLSIDNVEAFNFSVYPNPVKDGAVTINTTQLDGKDTTITVNNVLGQQIYRANSKFTGSTMQVDVFDGLPAGMYVITVESGDARVSRKLIKE